VCVYVCVCVYIYMCVCVYIYIYVCVCVYIYICVCVYIYMCVCVCDSNITGVNMFRPYMWVIIRLRLDFQLRLH